MDNQFEDTRPYTDSEIPAAMARVYSHKLFPNIIKYLFPDRNVNDFKTIFDRISSVHDVQKYIMYPFLQKVISMTMSDFKSDGIENVSDEKKSMFICNHRDILLDAALLDVVMFESELDTPEITFGSNLMQDPFVVDIGKSNKMFKIVRGGTARELYQNSKTVSSYMRYAITQKSQSVWIAQRNGRTKDGDDKTEAAVLKMFAMSSEEPFVENLNALNITPVVISYEYEPCDFLKTQELYFSKFGKYVKAPGEDVKSVVTGIIQKKGEVTLVITRNITITELELCSKLDKHERFEKLAQIIDDRIYSHYKLYKTNYIAYDILYQTNRFSDCYTETEKEEFVEYMNEGLKQLEGDYWDLKEIFLGIYANSVNNVLKLN